MNERRSTWLLGGLAVAFCPLLCIALPLAFAAGAAAAGLLGAGIAALALIVLAGLALARARRRRAAKEERCSPKLEPKPRAHPEQGSAQQQRVAERPLEELRR